MAVVRRSLFSANLAIDSDKFTGNMSDSIYYNTGKVLQIIRDY